MENALFPFPSGKTGSQPRYQTNSVLAFSYNDHHEPVPDNSALKYFKTPPHGADLNYGIERWVRHMDERGRLDPLLESLDRDEAAGILDQAGAVVTWRGMITKIITSPYERQNQWEMNAMAVNGTLFIEQYISGAEIQAHLNLSGSHLTSTYYGYAFESYCTSVTLPQSSLPSQLPSGIPAGWGGDVNNKIQWCQVVAADLGGQKLVLGGEVDCVRGAYKGTAENLVELKTSPVLRNKWTQTNYDKKLLKFWAQSTLLGIPEVFVGFRNQKGFLESTASLRTRDIPKGKHSWHAGTCLAFGRSFLQHLEGKIFDAESRAPLNSSPNVWRLALKAGAGIEVRLLSTPEIESEVRRGEDRVGFLPSAFYVKLCSGGI